jgi:Holliday junction resolvase RusA-like endonuclease
VIELKFEIMGVAEPKQSARHRIVNTGTKSFIHSYQSSKVTKNESNIRAQIALQLPKGFKPFDGLVFVDSLIFIFPIPQSCNKWKRELIESEQFTLHRYKPTKPDLPDNLKKALYDAMSGVVYTDDSKIVYEGQCSKIYGNIPMTIITMRGFYAEEYEKRRDL